MIIGTAAVKLEAALKNLQDMQVQSAKIVDIVTEKTVEVSNLEMRIEQLNKSYETRQNEIAANLELEFKTKRDEFGKNWLKERQLIPVEKEDYDRLNDSYKNLKAEVDNKVKAEVSKIHSQLTEEFKTKATLQEAEFQRKEAQNIAQIEQLRTQVENANRQAEMWKEQLVAERTASVERAKASAIGTVNVSPGK